MVETQAGEKFKAYLEGLSEEDKETAKGWWEKGWRLVAPVDNTKSIGYAWTKEC